MSVAEDIAEEALKLVLRDDVVVERNARPEFLKNPETGKLLELDFYLPQLKIGIEIQGQHHYSDDKQVTRDEIKRKLASDYGLYLIELSTFQIAPTVLAKKIYGGLCEQGLSLLFLKSFQNSWIEFAKEKVAPYRHGILRTYGKAEATTSPGVVRHSVELELEREKILNSWLVEFRDRQGIPHRGRVLRRQKRTFVVQPLGSQKQLFFRPRDLRVIDGLRE